jgi:hypothetical protein
MPDWSPVHRSHVVTAIEECDRLGSREFLQRYGFGRRHTHSVWHGGQEYDSKAIAGVAYLHATGTALTPADFSGGKDGAAKVLKDLGFDVVVNEEPEPTARARTAAPPKARKAAAPPAPRLCPTCHLAVPASGICDYCD